jgi:putative transposase
VIQIGRDQKPPSPHGQQVIGYPEDTWAYRAGVQIDFSRPGKPTDNAHVESFNGTLRAESL